MEIQETGSERTLTIKGEGMARGQTVKIKELPMNKIQLGRNSRMQIRNEDLSALMQSINSIGLLEPIGVVETKDRKGWEVAYGNRRYMAFSRLGLHSIPCVIRTRRNDHDIDVQNLAENVQRKNISLAEVGRYAKLLAKEGLGVKELAVRLGASENYINSAITAFEEVPEKFRNDLQMQTTGKKPDPGKISISAARAIVNAQKAYGMTRAMQNVLFTAAKENPKFNEQSVPAYAAAIKRGEKDPIGSVTPIKTLTFRFLLNEDEYENLIKKHVSDGPFNSFTALVKAVCRGQKAVKINFLD